MENWGLVTYREVDVLIDQAKASAQQKQRVTSVITHELAHQWFGNLVTMGWWDDLWLNEGFASWMQTYSADLIFPDWQLWPQFVTSEQAGALRADSLTSSHPIQVPIKHAIEVEQVFDLISYLKGACIVQLAYAVLGMDNFREGLQLYMRRHQYSNTETTDLWAAWEEVSGKPVNAIMKGWTEQMGFPVVTISNSKVLAQGVQMDLHQEWFLSNGDKVDSDKVWSVPLLFTVGLQDGTILESVDAGIMTDKTMTLTVAGGKWGCCGLFMTNM